WVKRTGPSSAAFRTVALKGPTSSPQYALGLLNTPTFAVDGRSTGFQTVSAPSSIPTGSWSHLVGVLDNDGGDELKLYVNGAQVASADITASQVDLSSTSEPLAI
ncbi:MAG: LamG-like jellyroll fold domain-containing protein, partial [Halobacteria archaeon]|nr:LamG-like jellyroll fold domain-containing protein [Halobacteria archaeon]